MNETRTGFKPCVVCGKQYKICRKCEEAQLNGSVFWRASCDTRDCFRVLLIVNDFYYNKISKAEAKSMLDENLTEEMLPYTPEVKALVEQIYTEDVESEVVLEINIEETELVEENDEVEPGIESEAIIIEEPVLYEPEINAEDVDENVYAEAEV